MQLEQDTIAAISTPPGRGAIGIVRLSGPGAFTIPRLSSVPEAPGRTHLTHVHDEHGATLDQAVVTFYRAPRSYTGEDVVEIACHGAPVLLDAVLRACLARGARLAEPGEFTRRAFLNGRLDLAQAEAVRDLIDAHTLEQARTAARQLGGSLALAIQPVKSRLLDLIAQLEAGIDFVEDDLDLMPQARIGSELAGLAAPLERLAGTYAYGRILRSGFTLALVGPPNAGKSSLFNALLGRDRAIVTAEPGTTRDTLTASTAIAGVPVTLIDTAGLREDPGTEAEALGIVRTRQAIAEADLILVLTAPDTTEREPPGDFPHAIHVRSKCDLDCSDQGPGYRTSARTGEGIDQLREAIRQRLGGIHTQADDELITSLRQHTALTAAIASLQAAANAAEASLPHEMLLLDLYTALSELDGLTGATPSEAVLHRIFAAFCIGK